MNKLIGFFRKDISRLFKKRGELFCDKLRHESREAIFFFSGEMIADHQVLYNLVKEQLSNMPEGQMKYLIIDEVTNIADWDKGIKYLADTGEFSETVVMLSGSDLILMQDARKRFPGRHLS